jgi:hypothetical protein
MQQQAFSEQQPQSLKMDSNFRKVSSMRRRFLVTKARHFQPADGHSVTRVTSNLFGHLLLWSVVSRRKFVCPSVQLGWRTMGPPGHHLD